MSFAESEDVLATAAAWRAAGEQVAVATVTETWGSSPRPAGSQLAVTKSGKMAGSVSGGCIEGAVADAAMQTIASGTPQLLDFGVSNERAWEVGLACGGKVKVYVERAGDMLDRVRAAAPPFVLATTLATGEQRLLGPDDAAARAALATDESALADGVFL